MIRSLGYKEVSLSACCIHEDRPKEPLDVTEILREGRFGISSSIEKKIFKPHHSPSIYRGYGVFSRDMYLFMKNDLIH